MRETKNPYNGIVGVPNEPVEKEEDHFYVCSHCGQAVDIRDLGQVFHHKEPNHERLPDDS